MNDGQSISDGLVKHHRAVLMQPSTALDAFKSGTVLVAHFAPSPFFVDVQVMTNSVSTNICCYWTVAVVRRLGNQQSFDYSGRELQLGKLPTNCPMESPGSNGQQVHAVCEDWPPPFLGPDHRAKIAQKTVAQIDSTHRFVVAGDHVRLRDLHSLFVSTTPTSRHFSWCCFLIVGREANRSIIVLLAGDKFRRGENRKMSSFFLFETLIPSKMT